MHSSYELYREKSKYNALRENVNNAINVLSSSAINDNFGRAIYSLENNYVVNGVTCKKSDLKNINEAISNDLSKLSSILSSINIKINTINQQIQDLEKSQGM